MQIEALNHILGKRVKVKDKQGKEWFGDLQFVGTNDWFPQWGLHCTVSRVPQIEINSIMDITLLEE